jgi:uncharacterized membrane protein
MATWYGTLIGLIAGGLIGASWLAWRVNAFFGIAVSILAGLVAVWLYRHAPVHVIGYRNSAFDRPRLHGENAVLFVLGFLVGGVLGFVGCPGSVKTPALVALFAVVVGVVCGGLSVLLGDRFWSR